MTEEKEKIWEEASRQSWVNKPLGDNWDRISIAMDLYAAKQNKELLKALESALERMGRARGILNKDENSNWGILDTSDLQPALNKAKG